MPEETGALAGNRRGDGEAMIVEAGHFALALALALALAQTAIPFWGARRGDRALMGSASAPRSDSSSSSRSPSRRSPPRILRSDFSVLNVAENSHSADADDLQVLRHLGQPRRLDAAVVADPGDCSARWSRVFGRALPARLRADALSVQGLIGAAFLAFILAPPIRSRGWFRRRSRAAISIRSCRTPGLAIHPPMLYMGYVGFSIVFSFAAAALIEGRIDAAWARFVRPFALIAWCFLTLGIAMGSYWAYYTLGWGGFWFWDPVENASLMPWLAGTAFLHSVAVMEKRDALKIWTIFLAILAFSFSLLGTFLVRSGVLTSVHAFASDPARGVVILAILAFFIAGSLALFAWRAPMLKPGGLFAPISREGALVLNNLLLTTACATVLFGTLYPLALEQLTGEKSLSARRSST